MCFVLDTMKDNTHSQTKSHLLCQLATTRGNKRQQHQQKQRTELNKYNHPK